MLGRIIRASCASALVGAAVVRSTLAGCGGQFEPGYIDDSGVYHAGDGAVLFVPGIACVGWDAAHLDDPSPNCNSDAAGPLCTSWIAGCSPPGFPFDVSYCEDDPGSNDGSAHCAMISPTSTINCPSLDALGDTFCVAWAQQFVMNGTAISYCRQSPVDLTFGCTLIATVDDAGRSLGVCVDENANPTGMYVRLDGGAQCQRPCQR
jgi:hypothetical protein